MEMLAEGQYQGTVFEDKWQLFRTKYLEFYRRAQRGNGRREPQETCRLS